MKVAREGPLNITNASEISARRSGLTSVGRPGWLAPTHTEVLPRGISQGQIFTTKTIPEFISICGIARSFPIRIHWWKQEVGIGIMLSLPSVRVFRV